MIVKFKAFSLQGSKIAAGHLNILKDTPNKCVLDLVKVICKTKLRYIYIYIEGKTIERYLTTLSGYIEVDYDMAVHLVLATTKATVVNHLLKNGQKIDLSKKTLVQ